MARRHLSQSLKEGGFELLQATDRLGMQAQGAMWVMDYSLEDWRFYLVTSLVDTIGRRRTYQLLIDVFSKIDIPDSITINDVHLGSPHDTFYRNISGAFRVENSMILIEKSLINGMEFDGVIYRSVREAPSPADAKKIERTFSKTVHDLSKGKGAQQL